MTNWQQIFLKFVDLGILAFRLFVQPFGLFKVNKFKTRLQASAGSPLPPAQITINAGEILAEIDPNIYGHFIEVLGSCIYGGIWDPANKEVPSLHGGLRQDVLDQVRQLNIPIIRWPGGAFADTYDWKGGIGPQSERHKSRNDAWHKYGPKIGSWHDNSFGIDEFMLFTKELDTNPYININFGSGTPEEAAQFVEYANGDENTEFGALRAKNGHPKPYDVKIWGVGNETYGAWEQGADSPDQYARKFLEYAKAMRAVDPSIKLVAVGTDFDYPKWDRFVLEIAGDQIDYLSLHVYIPAKALMVASNSVKDYYNIIAGAFEIERRAQWLATKIEEIMGDKRIPIALDEWGAWWSIRQLYEGYYTLRDGLFAASVLEALHRQADLVKMANWAQLVNVIPLIVTSPTDVYHNPVYLAFQIFNHAEKFVVSSKTECENRHIAKFGNIAEREIPYLGCSVTINKEKNRLVIIAINRHHGHEIPTTISLENFEPESTAQIFELNGPSYSAFNDFDKKNEVKIEAKEFSSASKQFMYKFPAHSVTALILTLKKA